MIASIVLFTISNILIVSKLKYSLVELLVAIYNSYKSFIFKRVCVNPFSNRAILKMTYERKYEFHLVCIILSIALNVGFIKDFINGDFVCQSATTKFSLIFSFLYLSYVNLCNYSKSNKNVSIKK